MFTIRDELRGDELRGDEFITSIEVMNINRELGFAEHLARCVRQSANSAKDRQKIVMAINKIGKLMFTIRDEL